MNNAKILVIIPARGGSKGIPRKNLRPLNGKPLIYYVINNALNINLDVDCYVSSEDEEILLLASKFGAKTIKRAQTIANDKVTLDPVIYDAFKRIKEQEKKIYDVVITLQPTSPLLKTESISEAISLVLNNDIDTVISGSYDSHLTWIKKENCFYPNYEKRVNRQELPEIYKETGGFVVTKAEFVLENSRFGKRIEILPISKREAIDIDDFYDWSLCEYYLKRKKILFVVTGNPKIGMGHVYNTLSIANEILNHSITFLVDKESTLAYEKIAESNYNVVLQQNQCLVEEIIELNPNVVINDILDTSEDYMKTLVKHGYKIINFEDLGEGSKYADVVINAMYPEGKILVNHYFGSKFFILKDEFLFTANKKIEKEVKNILISFGGVDPNNYTERILRLLHPLKRELSFDITVITGMGYEKTDELKESYTSIDIKTNIFNMSEEMLKADLVFTSAGRTTFEVASIGTPAIVLCQNRRETTHFFASEKNGFYNLGLGYEINDEVILQAFKDSLVFKNRQLMNKRMMENKLKAGKSRVMKLINATLEKA